MNYMRDEDYDELSQMASNIIRGVVQQRDEMKRQRDEARWLFAYAVSKLGRLEVHQLDMMHQKPIDLVTCRDEERMAMVFKNGGTPQAQKSE